MRVSDFSSISEVFITIFCEPVNKSDSFHCPYPFFNFSCRRWRRCTTKFSRAKWGNPRWSSKIWKLTPHFDLQQHLTISHMSRRGWNAIVSMSEQGKKKMSVLPPRSLLIIMIKMGAEAMVADRLFSTSVFSNGWNHVVWVWTSFSDGSFHLTIWWNACRE